MSNPIGDRRVLVGTDDGISDLRSGEVVLAGYRIDHIAPIPASVWVVADGSSLVAVPDRGDPESVVEVPRGEVHVVLPDGPRVWVGGSAGTLYRLRSGELVPVASFERAPGRSDWHTPWGGPPDVRSMDLGSDGVLYVNVHVGGILRSVDGEVWSQTIDIDADVHQVLADPEEAGRVYAATAEGLAVTDDGGESWSLTSEGLDASYCRAVARSRTRVFVSASRGPRGEQAAVYRRALGGGPLERCSHGLPECFSTNVDTHCLVAEDELVVIGDAEGTVYVSNDEGDSWEMVASGLPPIRCLAVA